MGIEIVVFWLGMTIASAFAVDKGVEVWKKDMQVTSEKYQSCVEYAKKVSECEGLE